MRYVLQVKGAPGEMPGGFASAGATPAASQPGPDQADPTMMDDPGQQAHEWAGDLYEQGDESDPADAFAGFTGQQGEQAWLDKADDGTLTGWVRDTDGAVYRYSDPDAWAVDVDDAGMQRGDTGMPDEGADDQPAEAEPGDTGDQEPDPGDDGEIGEEGNVATDGSDQADDGAEPFDTGDQEPDASDAAEGDEDAGGPSSQDDGSEAGMFDDLLQPKGKPEKRPPPKRGGQK